MATYEQSHETADNFNAYRDTEIPVEYLFGGLQNSNMYGGMDANALQDQAHRSIIGRFNYDFKGKYLAEFSFRRDGTSLYKPGADQYGFFPGASVGWVLTRENFFRKLVSDNTTNYITALGFEPVNNVKTYGRRPGVIVIIKTEAPNAHNRLAILLGVSR